MSRTFVAADEWRMMTMHVVLVTTGSVASIKAPLIVAELLKHDSIQVQVVATKASLTFFKKEDIETLSDDKHNVRVWTDEDEWGSWNKIGDPILHIEARPFLVIVDTAVAPCSANTLAKIAGGICDNIATNMLRALHPNTPTYIFPAMNTLMYEHPLTALHLKTIQETIGYKVIGPIGKNLACGDTGIGAMTEWKDIVKIVHEQFAQFRGDYTPSWR